MGMWMIGVETREIFMYYMRIRVIFMAMRSGP